ncbi:VOC family protein [Listeria fleischmannii]|uniref:3-demethylubiquinone-9 3-methyltransferase n=2 Tax=Listeria fleischmannii TaxID=1069827 RepID=W7DDA1_9LIST|nr:VOC family protein [Listeria fleischmannii]EUJ47145.1 3-demethylubiquinone-9 3-methyltransferase [Listeria fleischmannii FSL S10-1203]MBC1398144.1 VOC family protein [Listeria fleischmannii]MBC1417996.1 VOC family protein [Listeria fleischmannii]MBC1426205.1 VOC family protein [Listeria fleischmannii]STY34482.1 3-demethylubiquinone-9 3-methyltransferase [Listeria fleischmannii subsp. coloradonensis]
MEAITPFLMFQNKQSAKAIELYLNTFHDAHTVFINHHPNPEDGIMLGKIKIHQLEILVSDSSVNHDFNFTPSSSFFIDCESLEELKEYAEKLSANGNVLMPLNNYGFSQQFTWVNDAFGVSWQLNLP